MPILQWVIVDGEPRRQTSVLETRRHCIECDRTQVVEWIRDWDEVLVELRIDGARRPDIVLCRAGKAIAAVEIVVSHASTRRRSARFVFRGSKSPAYIISASRSA
jgi:hypothetical protein